MEGGQMDSISELVARAAAGDLQADLELTAQAAAGSLDAQRALRDSILGADMSRGDALRVEALSRFAAVRGDLDDCRKLAGTLWLIAQVCRYEGDEAAEQEYATEALAIYRGLADEGDAEGLKALAHLPACYPEAWAAIEAVQSQPRADPVPLPVEPEPDPAPAPAPAFDSLSLFPPMTRGEEVRASLSDTAWALGYAWECFRIAVAALFRKGE